MRHLLEHLKGDRGIWGAFTLLALFSFLPMYSASTNLAYVVGSGSTTGYFLKHFLIVFLGAVILYITHKIPYKYFSGISVLLLPLVFILLIYTLSQGQVIKGAMAARWIRIPFVGISFQTSTLANLSLMIYVARYFSKRKDKAFDFNDSLKRLWVPVGLILMPILPSNFSTTALIYLSIIIICILVGYPIKFLLRILGVSLGLFIVFIAITSLLSPSIKVKVKTWKNRIVNFNDPNPDASYQVERAKMAIATGGALGLGSGKSIQKNFLHASSTDFIFAIIIEEWGLVGGVTIILVYIWLLFRIWVVAKKSKTIFATLMTIGIGYPIIIQAIVNMAVASNLIPVTGQNLPLLTNSGTSIWMTCIAIGMILSVSAATEDEEDSEVLENDNPLDVLYEKVG